MTYALLKTPAHTRVSFQDSDTLAISELNVLFHDTHIEDARMAHIGGVQYILFDIKQPLSQSDIRLLSRMSFIYAVFEFFPDENILKPVGMDAGYFLPDDLSTILKYVGKTNELFTRLMLNMAQLYIKKTPEQLNILDPLAGKGTTLYEALMQGHNAYGVEIDAKMAAESVTYLKKYLETAKHKHENHSEKTSGQSPFGKFTALRSQIKIKPNAHFEIVAGDTRHSNLYFKKNFFHAIIADLPYGVQHSSKTAKKPQSTGFTRNALGLVKEALPAWTRVLAPGGVIVIAWNLFLIPRMEMSELLTQHGFALPEIEANFSHRVDQAIDRDFIVGVKK